MAVSLIPFILVLFCGIYHGLTTSTTPTCPTYASAADSICCEYKTVGSYNYRLTKEVLETGGMGCQDDCIYKTLDGPQAGSLACFTRGSLPVECLGCCPYETSSGMHCIPRGETIAWAEKCLYISCPIEGLKTLELQSAFRGCDCCVGKDKKTLYEDGAVRTLPSGVIATCINGSWVSTTPSLPGNCSKLTVRKSVMSLTPQEIQKLDQALQGAKGGAPTMKFEDIANYHGAPYMCDLTQTGPGTALSAAPCCRAHVLPNGYPPASYQIHFLAWHRLFVYQMEWALQLHDSSIAIPYWDWTAPLPTSWPLAGTSWDNGPIKSPALSPPLCGGGSTTHRQASGLPMNYHTNLKNRVAIALQKTDCLSFNKQLVGPHDGIHGSINCDMGGIGTASYDPIFYLNHAYVDYLFAYWQELQALRGLTACGSSPWSNVKMEPFNRLSNPNPISLKYSEAGDTNDYQNNFCYKYDKLLFCEMTPMEFLNYTWDMNSGCENGTYYAGLTRPHTGISSHQSYDICYSDECYHAGDFYTFGINITGNITKKENKDPYITKYDITEIMYETGLADRFQQYKNVAINTRSYQDLTGYPISSSYSYKPVLTYKPPCPQLETVYIQIPDCYNMGYQESDCYGQYKDQYAETIYMDPPYNVEIYDKYGKPYENVYKQTYGGEEYAIGPISIQYQEETLMVYNECDDEYKKMIFGYDKYFKCEDGRLDSLYPGEVTVVEWATYSTEQIYQSQGTRLIFAWCSGGYYISKVDKETFYAGSNPYEGGLYEGPMSYAVDTSQPGTFYFLSGNTDSTRIEVVVTENQFYRPASNSVTFETPKVEKETVTNPVEWYSDENKVSNSLENNGFQ